MKKTSLREKGKDRTMELNGKDYTIQAVILLTILVLFFLQYVLCKKTKNPWIRAIPFLAPLAALIGADKGCCMRCGAY